MATTSVAGIRPAMSGCAHVGQIRMVTPSAKGCEDCLRIGARWSTCACALRAATSGAAIRPRTGTRLPTRA
jgi:hypothetical protein